MARIKDQNIPPALASLYAGTLGPSRDLAYPGSQHPGLDQVAETHYPATLEPPHVPTEKQRKQREYFQIAFECFNKAPDNERTAYWRLSKAGPIPYYNDYMRKNIPLAIEGFQCPFWAAPNARSFISDQNNTWGRYEIHLSDCQDHFLSLVLELDPIEAPEPPPPWPTPDAPYGLVHFWFNWETYTWVAEELYTWDPDNRSEYEVDFEIPAIVEEHPVHRNLFFTRYGVNEQGEAVVWYADIDDPGATFGYWNFE
jgi:hypothetical protein